MAVKPECIAMLLAGGQGSRLGVLTENVAKPAVAFGGKYRIVDFPLSNCINSGVDTVGVLTQYQPLRLNTHIGIGIPWDLDRNVGGVTVLPPYEKNSNSDWYTGTANAIYQNIDFIDRFDPDYVVILSDRTVLHGLSQGCDRHACSWKKFVTFPITELQQPIENIIIGCKVEISVAFLEHIIQASCYAVRGLSV